MVFQITLGYEPLAAHLDIALERLEALVHPQMRLQSLFIAEGFPTLHNVASVWLGSRVLVLVSDQPHFSSVRFVAV